MRFAWDGLLSEIGFISVFFAPFSFKSINYIFQLNNIAFYVLKFILAKFMVSTGINIIGSQCPYWTSFIGLSFFFQGQPLLSSLSFYFHYYLSDNATKILSAFGYFCILYLPLGYFLVWRRFSIYAGQITFLFNLFFIFVGNYGVLNLLVIILNTINFDDYFFRSILSQKILNKFKLDYLSLLIPLYRQDQKQLNEDEKELGRIKNEMNKENEKKEGKDEQKIKELTEKFNKLKKKIFEFEDDDFDDSPKIQSTFKIESSIIKECFIFINFLCANLLFVYIILYPIKRLVQGLSIIEQLPKHKFKTTLIIFSVYIFIYIVLTVIINLISKLKLTMFSEKGMMNSVMNEIIENNKKKGNITNEDIQKQLKEGLNKKNYIKILFYAMLNLIKMSKYIIVVIIFSIYYLGSVKYFLLSIDVELFPTISKTDDSNDLQSPNSFQNFGFLSDILFSNYNVYGVYGNTQQEIQSVLGRSELEIEYTTEINKNKWNTVNFNYKLGPNNSVPKFLFFYMPRIDWKINVAAKDEDLNNDSWIIILLGKIFERNPIIMDLLGYEVEEKKYYEKLSLFERVKEIYFGKKKYELMPEINKLKIDIFKYQFLKNKDNKNKNRIFKRKRYKEYISPIEKHTLLMVYEKIGLSKPNPNKKTKFNKFQFIPVVDLVFIYFLFILLKH
jgi:ABC-type multidrug transport system fused ATPase/permease subunit